MDVMLAMMVRRIEVCTGRRCSQWRPYRVAQIDWKCPLSFQLTTSSKAVAVTCLIMIVFIAMSSRSDSAESLHSLISYVIVVRSV